jgi:hypothetical protein
MTVKRMDNVGIVVESLDVAISFLLAEERPDEVLTELLRFFAKEG